MALSKEKFHLRTEHSKLLGYWTVELGGLNQVKTRTTALKTVWREKEDGGGESKSKIKGPETI